MDRSSGEKLALVNHHLRVNKKTVMEMLGMREVDASQPLTLEMIVEEHREAIERNFPKIEQMLGQGQAEVVSGVDPEAIKDGVERVLQQAEESAVGTKSKKNVGEEPALWLAGVIRGINGLLREKVDYLPQLEGAGDKLKAMGINFDTIGLAEVTEKLDSIAGLLGSRSLLAPRAKYNRVTPFLAHYVYEVFIGMVGDRQVNLNPFGCGPEEEKIFTSEFLSLGLIPGIDAETARRLNVAELLVGLGCMVRGMQLLAEARVGSE